MDQQLENAENLLITASFSPAYDAAFSCLTSNLAEKHPTQCAITQRALYVMLQAKYQQGVLEDITDIADQMQVCMADLPAPVVLLWGVIALQLQKAVHAERTIKSYIHGLCTSSSLRTGGVSAEDRLALARLYAVRIMGASLQDPNGALTWLHKNELALPLEQHRQLLDQVQKQHVGNPPYSSSKYLSTSAHSTCAAAEAPTAHASPPSEHGAGSTHSAGEVGDSPFCSMMGEMNQVPPLQAAPGSPDEPCTPSSSVQGSSGRDTDQAGGGGSSSSLAGRGPPPNSQPCDGQPPTPRPHTGGLIHRAYASGEQTLHKASEAGSSWLRATREQMQARGVSSTQVVLGAAVTGALLYSVYAERRSLRRRTRTGTAAVITGVMDVLEMALGFRPNPMGAAPFTA